MALFEAPLDAEIICVPDSVPVLPGSERDAEIASPGGRRIHAGCSEEVCSDEQLSESLQSDNDIVVRLAELGGCEPEDLQYVRSGSRNADQQRVVRCGEPG